MVNGRHHREIIIPNIEQHEYISMDPKESAAATYYSNALALIKLREKKSSKVSKIPKGV